MENGKHFSAKHSEEEEVVEVDMSYEMGWQKCRKRFGLSSGIGTAVRLKMQKVLKYATRNTMCPVCRGQCLQ